MPTNSGHNVSSVRLALVMVFMVVLVGVSKSADAQTFRVLHTFTGQKDGGDPADGLVSDSSGNVYGTTQTGGTFGLGAVYEISPAGRETVLYSFATLTGGFEPFGTLVRDASGNLYGTTFFGGNTNCGGIGCGVVFKISTPKSGFSRIKSFSSPR